MSRIVAVAVLVVGLAGSGAMGGGSRANAATSSSKSPAKTVAAKTVAAKVRVVTIDMQAITYSSKLLTVKAGEPIDLRFRNTSTLTHEALIGDQKVQDEHEKMASTMAMAHADTKTMVTVKAGATKTLRYTFAKAGRTIIGCHQPGHYGSGMKLTVIIEPRTAMG